MPWSVDDYSTNPDENTSINGIDIDEFCSAEGYNNALRQFMADVKAWIDAYEAPVVEFPITLAQGGTGRSDLTALTDFLPLIGGLSAIYLDQPQVIKNTGFTLLDSYRGRHIYWTGGADNAVVPANVLTPMPVGSRVRIVNNGTGALSIRQTTAYSPNSVIRWSPGNAIGDRDLAVGGIADLLKVESDLWYVSGSGLS